MHPRYKQANLFSLPSSSTVERFLSFTLFMVPNGLPRRRAIAFPMIVLTHGGVTRNGKSTLPACLGLSWWQNYLVPSFWIGVLALSDPLVSDRP
jgi:hypothetical protein